jgi:hypothetical protein
MPSIDVEKLLDFDQSKLDLNTESVKIVILFNNEITSVELVSKSVEKLSKIEEIPDDALVFDYSTMDSSEELPKTFNEMVLSNGLKVWGNFNILPIIRKIF